MKKLYLVLFALIFLGIGTYKLNAQDMTNKMADKTQPLLVKLVANDLMETGKKVISLAEAMPESDYSWRPEKGVRSVSEVYVHLAASNYFFFSYLGMEKPKDFQKGSENENLEKTMTKKEDIVKFLKKSFDDTQKFLANYNPADFNTKVKLPFGEFTIAQVLMLAATHPHEHLGQSIAYARTNHITPPWSLPKKK